MKKLLTKILIGVLAVTMLLGLTACGSDSSWKETSMKSWGSDLTSATQGGFVVEKENYIYYINGVEANTADNTFGAPVKGALMAVDKKDFSKTEVVVPKLFVAKDYNAGLYIYGDYVYYGTPNTEKNSEGKIANDELTFMKTKLDGTDTTKLFTLSNLSDEYRIVKSGDSVVIIYDDTENNTINLYNCSNGQTTPIVKADAEVEGVNGESLNTTLFAGSQDEYLLYYAVTVYAEEYNEKKEDSRATESYNKVYGYSAKDGVVLLLDGSKDAKGNQADNPITYEMKMARNGVMYYSETVGDTTKTYFGYGETKTEVTNTEALADTTLFVSNEEVYTVSEGTIVKTSLVGKYNLQTRNVAKDTGATKLLAKNGDNIYFIDADSGISRINVAKADANVEKVTASTVDTAWYPIEFIENKLFYCDNSADGASYVKYVDVNGEVKVDDTDEENVKYYLEGQTLLGKMTDADVVSVATAKVTAITNGLVDGALSFEDNGEGKLFVKAVDDAVSASKDVELSEETATLLAKYQKAVEMANLYNKLEGIRDELKANGFESAYNEVKASIEAFRASEDYSEVSAYIGNNKLWNYQRAVELFGSK